MKKLFSILCVCAMVFGMLPVMAFSVSAEVVQTYGGYRYLVQEDGSVAIMEYIGSSSSPSVPSKIAGRAVERLEVNSFANTAIESITLPSGLKEIGSGAFANCTALTSIVLPDSIYMAGEGTFKGCSALTSVKLSKGMTGIDYTMFAGCSNLKSVTLPEKLEYINGGAFLGCVKLQNFTLPDTLTSLGWRVFEGCAGLTSITIPGSVKKITEMAFYGCSGLESVTIRENTTTVGSHTFYSCGNLKSVVIPETVTAIELSAFASCRTLTDVYFGGTKNQWNSVVVEDCNDPLKQATIHYNCSFAKIAVESATAAYAGKDQNASVKVTAEGDGLSYTWYIKNAGQTKYSKSSITTDTYKTKMTAANSGRLVYCVVKDKYGNEVRSKTFVLRMKATVTKEPATAAYAKKGAKVSVPIGAAGDGLTYTWYIKNANGTKYSKSSVTSATYSAMMSDTVKGRRVYCVVKDKYGKTAQTKTFMLREAVSITTQPKTTTTAKGSIAKATVKASGDGLTYTWYIKNAGQATYSKSSITKATYSVTMSNTSKNRLVYCVVKDQYGKTAKSNTVQLKMK